MTAKLVLSTLLLLFLTAAAPGSCTTYTVCPSGCSFSSISAAVNAAQDGDIIDLTAPTYDIVGMSIQRSFTMRTGPAGVLLQGGPFGWSVWNGTLTLDGSFRFNNAAQFRVWLNGTVNALGDVSFSSVGGNTMFYLDGLWHSYGTLSISANNPRANAVFLYGGSTLITDGPVTLQGVGPDPGLAAWTELVMSAGTWEQNGPLTISVQDGIAGVRAQMGTWKQNGAVTALATNTSQAIKLAGMGVWEQWGPINISLAQRAIGVFAALDQRYTWRQMNSLSITAAADSHADTGVLMARNIPGDSRWMQSGEVTIRAARGVVIGSTASVTSYPGTWWNQTAPASIYVDDAAGPSFAVGVSMNYTVWVAAERTTVYTSLVDRAVLCLNSSYVRLSQDALVEVVNGAQTTERIPCPSPSPSPSCTPTRSPSPSRTPTSSPSSSPSRLPASPSSSPTPTVTPTPSSTQSPTQSPTRSPTSSPSNSPTRSATPTASQTPSGTPSVTPTRSPTSSPSSSVTPTQSPTASPSATATPSLTPSGTPTRSPTSSPTSSVTPTRSPAASPSSSVTPSVTPTSSPSSSVTPTQSPTASPSATATPSLTPSGTPTRSPTSSPTSSVTPTRSPTQSPTASVTPSGTPSATSTRSPTPSMTPTHSPTRSPTASPTRSPSPSPSPSPWVPPCQPALLGGGFSAFILGSAAPASPNAAAAMVLANGATGGALAVRGGLHLSSFNINQGRQACDDEGYGVVVEGCGVVVDVSNSRLSCGGLLASTDANIVSLPSFVGSAGLTVGNVQELSGINFAVAEAKLTTASQRLCNDTPSGTVQVTSWGAITLTGTGNQPNQTFRVQASDLASATSMQLVGISAALKLQTVVINVVGASAEQVVSLSNFFVNLGSVPVQTVVWNICGASNVVISRFQFPGVLLAPRSNVTLENCQVRGQVIAKTLQGGSFQITPSCA